MGLSGVWWWFRNYRRPDYGSGGSGFESLRSHESHESAPDEGGRFFLFGGVKSLLLKAGEQKKALANLKSWRALSWVRAQRDHRQVITGQCDVWLAGKREPLPGNGFSFPQNLWIPDFRATPSGIPTHGGAVLLHKPIGGEHSLEGGIPTNS